MPVIDSKLTVSVTKKQKEKIKSDIKKAFCYRGICYHDWNFVSDYGDYCYTYHN